ncbi:hypothetical protein JW813_12950 [Clostridium botulinum]|uniref:hypothetical protein n=1 Tax=Clostridium botulinum TaxID=1491 RepID=UPI002247771C|nr:hypothetical protein [Clostridium botulinum]UZP02616.1 hypothetical protein JW813_12950 [Clostridium botulinum]UZP05974.1 hypothetical protein JYA71_13220 [Clostridium botulinum]UZP09355.1 hypothetical protein JYA74_12945 [Clostridium botulinum]
MKKAIFNKEKSIGQVIFIVEGANTEFYLLHKIFTKIFDYQYERITRYKPYKKYNSKINDLSKVIVINTEESNIKFVDEKNEYLNQLFEKLIDEYRIDVSNAAIYYIFDRDSHSNTDKVLINNLLSTLKNSRENDDYYMQGLLLLSYPAIESFTLSNFDIESYLKVFDKGSEVKEYLASNKLNQKDINEESLLQAVNQFDLALKRLEIETYDIDNFGDTNKVVFEKQEELYSKDKKYNILSLLSIALIDLQLIDFVDEDN